VTPDEDTVLRPQPAGIPLPRSTGLSEPYWEAARRHQLVFQHCPACGAMPRRPAATCIVCGSEALEWARSSGRGTLYSWTVVWRPQHPSFRTPYAPAVMAMAEGWWLMTAVIDCRPEELTDGLALEVVFHDVGEDIWLPYARPLATP
jgi:uncharacterized OB-fold protein